MQNIVTTVYIEGSMITIVSNIVCVHCALNCITVREVPSMPNIRKCLSVTPNVPFCGIGRTYFEFSF